MRLLDRDSTYQVEIDGATFTVKPFTHAQELNFARFQSAPFLHGTVSTLRGAVELSAGTVPWVTDEDVEKLVDLIGDCVINFSGIEGFPEESIEEITSPKELVQAMSYTNIIALGRKIDNLSGVTDEQEQD